MTSNPGQPSADNTNSLKMGELVVASGNTALRTLLGSCVGLALFSKANSAGGLAHIVLPDSHGRSKLPGKYVDTAVPELIERISQLDGSKQKLYAKIAGGANMLNQSSDFTIGDRVLEALRNCLSEFDIPILGEHCGGNRGRRMLFWPPSGKVRIELVGGESFEI